MCVLNLTHTEISFPRLPPVVEGLENLSPRIKENAETVQFLDINPASRSAVSFNGTVKALPLDTDYVAIGWRQDVFFKHGLALRPPSTIEELASLSEQLHGLDHNGDGEPDWGICISPQVNYFYAFVAPVLQSQKFDSDTFTPTGQNIFFDTVTYKPLLRVVGFRYALEQYWRVIRSSNCPEQLENGKDCDRRTAWTTGRCAMVISMPGTLTSMLLDTGSRAPENRTDEDGNVVWSVRDQPLGPGGAHWGRRARFPGSRFVQDWETKGEGRLLSCADEGSCPMADSDGINYAPFFAEGGEAYALNGRQSKPSARDVMWDVFAWMSELPVSKLPLSGQYRKSHLNKESRDELVNNEGWSEQSADDLLTLLGYYFKGEDEGGNPAQDLLVLGFSDYMDALDEELHTNFLGIKLDSRGGLLDRTNPANSIDPVDDADAFDAAYEHFIMTLEHRYEKISKSLSGGSLSQLQRWRQSLNLPWKSDIDLCSMVLAIDPQAFDRLDCCLVVDMEKLCINQPDDVAAFDPTLCKRLFSAVSTSLIVGVSLLLLATTVVAVYFVHRRNHSDSFWAIDSSELNLVEPRKVIGEGTFGMVVLAEYRGTRVAVKQLHSTSNKSEAFTPGVRLDDSPCGKTSQLGLPFAAADSNQGLVAAFEHEMTLLSNLRHPCIATVMGAVVKKRESPLLVMEYMELGSLHDVLHNATISLDGDLVLPILQEISQGVRFLHNADPPIVHCDLKSRNVLIDNKFRAKVRLSHGLLCASSLPCFFRLLILGCRMGN